MALINGSDCVLMFNVHADYEAFVCAKSFSLTTSTELIETTTKGAGQWKSYKPNALAYTISLAGIAKLDDASTTVFDLLSAQLGFTEVPFRAIFTDKDGTNKIIEGIVVVTSTSFDATASNYLENNIELQGTGGYEIKDTIEGCDTMIPKTFLNVQVRQYPLGTEGSTTVYVEIQNISGEWQKINYSVDGSAPLSEYVKDFFINDLALGTHTLTLTPVCPNGIEGIPFVKTFSMS